ncbi:MAG: DUF2079 domain-containing protein [Verrucomicrobiota bacterium]
MPLADRDLVRFVRTVGALALTGASVAMAVAHARIAQLGPFISGNVLSGRGRTALLISLVVGAAAGLALAAALYFPRGTRGGLARLSRAALLLAPLTLAGLVPGLLVNDGWPDTLKLVVTLGAFLLGLEPLWRLHFSAYPERRTGGLPPPEDEGWPRSVLAAARALSRLPAVVGRRAERLPALVRAHIPAAIVGAMAVFYIAYMAFYTVRNHHRFNTFTWDLGQINNQFYNFLHGHPFRCTALIREGNWSELRNHAEATMFFLLPIYALWPSAEILLILQAVLLGTAGIFVYRIAARRVSRPVAVLLAAAYYLYPPLHGAQFFDIHFQPVAAAFMLAAIDFFDSRRMRLFVVFFILTILCREDISIGTAVFGLFLMLTGHRVRAGVVIFVVSLAYFVAVRFVIMPAVGPWGFADHYRHLFPAGEGNFRGIIRTILTNPVFTLTTLLTAEKLRYLLQILTPVAFLPLRRVHLALSILPGAYFTLLTTGYPPTLDIGYQYSGYFIPYIFPAAALALAAITRQHRGREGLIRQRAAVATLVAATLVTTIHWGAIPPRTNFHSSYGTISFDAPTADHIQRRRDIHELERMVPRTAILAVSDREMPHVANRVECWNISTGFKGSDYILYGKVNPIAPDTTEFDAALRAGYVRVAEKPSVVLLKRP